MKRLLVALSLSLCAQGGMAQGSSPEPAAAKPLPGCGVPALLSGWRFHNRLSAYKTRDLKVPLGKAVRSGDALFYVALEDARKLYSSPELIELKDRSPFNRDSQVRPGDQLEVIGMLEKIDTDVSYEVLEVGGGFLSTNLIPVKPDGMLCSDVIGKQSDGRWGLVGMPIFFQASPLTSTTVEFQGAKRRSAAVVLQSLDAAVINVAITVSVDGQVVRRRQHSFDLMSGQVGLGDLQLNLHKSGDGVVVDGVSEPRNYRKWLDSI